MKYNKYHVFVVIAFFIFVILSATLNFPILGSDEYAYFISGKYSSNLNDLYSLDPGLQRAENYLYFNIVNFFNNVAGDNYLFFVRVLQNVFYCFTGIILWKTFENILDDKFLCWGIFCFLLLPNSIFIYTIMPEVFLAFLSACVGYLLIKVMPFRPILALILAGFCIAIAQFIKPHAIAILLATFLSVIGFYATNLIKNNWLNVLKGVLAFSLTYYLTIIALWRVFVNEWILNISPAIGLKTYGQYLRSGDVNTNYFNKITDAFMYASAHFAVVVLIFAPVVVWMLICLRRIFGHKNSDSLSVDQHSDFGRISIFIFTSLLMHITMTAWFTVGAAALSDGEAMRLHGRYLGSVIIFMPFLYFLSIKNLTVSLLKLSVVLLLISASACFFYYFKIFKIFPWDYPLLFAFYQFPNHYTWNYAGTISFFGRYWEWIFLASLLFALYYKFALKNILIIQFYLIVFLGLIQTYGWMFDHLKNNAATSNSARAIAQIVNSKKIGDGVVFSSERYGRTSYLLFNLSNAPRVVTIKIDDSITEEEVKNMNWVLIDGAYKINFAYLNYIQIESFKLYILKSFQK